jgi:uncharacterized repeat protein (TIGR01451 family)
MQRRSARIVLAAALTGLAACAFAQAAPGPLESRLEQRKVVRAANGSEALVPVDAVRPGDVIEYKATYRNLSAQSLRNVEATLPIPFGTELLSGSARPAPAAASADGVSFAALPLQRVVRRAGVDVREPVPAAEYRALRWAPVDLAGEGTFSVVARVKVPDDSREARGAR